MADIDKIKRNVGRMIDQSAPESDIDAYLAEEGISADQLRSHKSAAPVGTGEDVTRSTAKGLGTGVAALPGSFGDISQLNSDIATWGAEKLGAPDWLKSAAGTAGKYLTGPMAFMPTTQQVSSAMAGATRPDGGQSFMDYEPQTTAGEYANTLGEFAPSAVLGPGRVGAKIGTGVAAALGSETAGQMTDGTAIEPYARFAGAVAGGGAVNLKNPRKAALANAPSDAQVNQMTKSAYDEVKRAGIVYDPNAYQGFASKLWDDLHMEGIDQTLHPKAYRALERVAEKAGSAPTYQDVETLRRIAGDVLKTKEPSEYRMASRIFSELDKLEDSGAFVSQAGYSPDQVRSLTTTARELGRRKAILGDLNEMDRKSEWYVSGDESGVRNQIASYGKSSKGKRLTESESKAFNKIVRREGVQNVASTLGGRLSLATLPGTLATAGGLAFGPVGAVAGGAAGLAGSLGGRKAMEAMSRRAFDKTKKTVALGKKGQAALKSTRRVSLPASSLARVGLFGAVPSQIGG